MSLVLLFAGSGMGGGAASVGGVLVGPIGRKVGIERTDGADINMRTGVTGS